MIARGGPRPPPGTLNQLFFDAVERYRKPDALQVKVGGRYEPVSHATLAERVRRVALGLRSLGIARGDRVAILSTNRPEWAIADLGCLTAQLTDVPIYPTLPPEQVAYILRDAGAVAIFVADAQQLAKVAAVRGEIPAVRTVITFADTREGGADLTLVELEERGRAAETAETIDRYRDDALAVQPHEVATLIYTSGTTGAPKGVMLTHDNIFSNVEAARQVLPFEEHEVSLSLLPLSHIFERMAGHYLMLAVGASIAYAESIDTVAANLLEVRPTFLLSVPRLYEKFHARVVENAMSGGAVKKRIFLWAQGVAQRWTECTLAGKPAGPALTAQLALARRLVFSKIRQRMGGRLRVFVSGGAPLPVEINKFFYGAGLVILEGYGLTETSPVIAVNTPKHFRVGTVGKPVAGVEVRIADDGEILARGPGIMKGYYNNPEATAEAIDRDGWFHTGDIGELRDGFLAITDRKKDLIVTAGGKKIAPQPIENAVRTNKYVSQAVMIGDKRRFAVLLVVPNFEQLEQWAKRRNLAWTDRAQLIANPLVKEKMEREVESRLTGLARFEMPKKIALLEHDFSIERGELTPTLKVKRRVVDGQYKSLIDSLYADEPVPA